MATNPKMKPCPHCSTADYLGVYKYESGWCYVECDNAKCTGNFYRGPGEGSIRQAIKSHNEKVMKVAAATPMLSEIEIAALCGGKKAAARLRQR